MNTLTDHVKMPGAAVAVALLSAAVFSALTPGQTAQAANTAHQHGVGELNVVVEGAVLAVEVRMPAFDVVGFEHAPETDEQKQAVQAVLAGFTKEGVWFVPSSAAECTLHSAQAALAGISTGADDHDKTHEKGHDHEKEHGEKHDHDREHGHHQDKDDDHKHGHEHEGEVHSDFEGNMEFECGAPEQLEHIEALLFNQHPGVRELSVQLVTPGQQIKRQLSASQPILKLAP